MALMAGVKSPSQMLWMVPLAPNASTKAFSRMAGIARPKLALQMGWMSSCWLPCPRAVKYRAPGPVAHPVTAETTMRSGCPGLSCLMKSTISSTLMRRVVRSAAVRA
jgi:hypothetical protein